MLGTSAVALFWAATLLWRFSRSSRSPSRVFPIGLPVDAIPAKKSNPGARGFALDAIILVSFVIVFLVERARLH